MLNTYDLYDLHAILINIRHKPEYKLNREVLIETINILKNWQSSSEMNQIRIALQSIPSLDKDMYGFAFVKNLYSYIPEFLKNKSIYIILIDALECLLKVIKEKNKDNIIDLADCLHNLPIVIADHHFIPNEYWNHEVKFYRNKWDKDFLVKYQMNK